MSQHQMLLDAACSAVELLNTVLSQEPGRGIGHQATSSFIQHVTNNSARANQNEASMPYVKRNANPPTTLQDGTMPVSQPNGNGTEQNITYPYVLKSGHNSSGKPVANPLTDNQRRVKDLKDIVDKRLGQALAHRVPLKVAKVTPQQLVTKEILDEITVIGDSPVSPNGQDWRAGYGGGASSGGYDAIGGVGGPSGGGASAVGVAGEENDTQYELIAEHALAGSVLILENAKLREELTEVKTELAMLRLESAIKKQVVNQSVGVQTLATDLRYFFYPAYRKPLDYNSGDGDEETDFFTTYSYSSSDEHGLTRPKDLYTKPSSSAYHTPASDISTPGTLGRKFTSASSSGVRKKLEIPTAMKRAGYLSLTTTYDESDDAHVDAPGCCACF